MKNKLGRDKKTSSVSTKTTALCAAVFLLAFQTASAEVTQFSFVSSPDIPLAELTQVTVQAQNSSGEAEAVGATTCIYAESTSPTGKFAPNESTDPSKMIVLTMNSNWKNRNFYYIDSSAGTYVLKVSVALKPDETTCSDLPVSEWDVAWGAEQTIAVGDSASGEEGEVDGRTSAGSAASAFEPEKSIRVSMSAPQDAIVGADALFKADAYGFLGEPLESAELIWNMGDGEVKKGSKVLHAYRHPGEYIVYVDAKNGRYSTHDRATITAHPADISLSYGGVGADSFIAVSNRMRRELDLSGWHLRVGKSIFTLPERSIILPRKAVRYDFETTKLVPTDLRPVELLYPNATAAVAAGEEGDTATPPSGGASQTAKSSHTASSNTLTQVISRGGDEKIEAEEKTKQESAPALAVSDEVPDRRDVGGENSLYPWLLGLGVIVLAGAFGIYSFGGADKEEFDLEKIVDEIEILEE